MREAKLDSNWVQPNLVHEKAATAFLDSLLPGAARHALLCNIAAFAGRLAPASAVNSLSQMVLRLMSPGVPALYKGTEFWEDRKSVVYGKSVSVRVALGGRSIIT